MINIYKLTKQAKNETKKILERPEVTGNIKGETEIRVNEWARTGYTMRDGRALGFGKEEAYLYIKANEEFFTKNEAEILKINGLTKIKGEEYEKIKNKIEEEQNNVAAGIGSIFNI